MVGGREGEEERRREEIKGGCGYVYGWEMEGGKDD